MWFRGCSGSSGPHQCPRARGGDTGCRVRGGYPRKLGVEFTGWGEGGVSGKGAPSLQPGAGLSSPPPAPPRSSLMGTEVEPLQGPCHGGGGQWQRVEDRRRGQGTVRPPPGRTHRTVLRPQPHPSDPEPGAHQEHPGRDKPGTGPPAGHRAGIRGGQQFPGEQRVSWETGTRGSCVFVLTCAGREPALGLGPWGGGTWGTCRGWGGPGIVSRGPVDQGQGAGGRDSVT